MPTGMGVHDKVVELLSRVLWLTFTVKEEQKSLLWRVYNIGGRGFTIIMILVLLPMMEAGLHSAQ